MEGDAKPVEISAYAEKLIQRTARRLVKKLELPKADIEDMEQDLRLELVRRLPAYDPGKSNPATFARMVIQFHAKEIARRHGRPKRCSRLPVISLSEKVSDEDGDVAERAEVITRADDKRLMVHDDTEAIDMAIDVGEAVRRLPEEERELCELLSTMSIPKAARHLGMYEGTLRLRVEKLRRKFRRAGLEVYVKNPMRDSKNDANT